MGKETAGKAAQFFLSSSRGNVVFLIIVASLIFFLNLNGWDLWNPDEPRYAQVAQEMRATGDWTLPHLNSEIYSEKPPLFFWLIASFSFLTGGVDEISARLPSALAALGCIMLTFFIGKRLFDQKAGFFAALGLLTSVEFFWLGRRANIDMALCFWVTLTITFFLLGLQEEKRSRSFYLIPYVVMGIGVLTKGPVGFLLPFLTMVVYLTAIKNFRHFKKLEIPWGLVIFILIISAWLIPACVQGGEAYTQKILFRQNIERFADTWTHQQPFYYYLEVFPAGFIPWIVLLPGALLWGFSKDQREHRLNFYFPLCWFLTIFIFFSLSTSKRELYLLPLYPAASLLLGGFISSFISSPEREGMVSKLLLFPFYVLGGIFILGGIGVCIFPFIKTPVSGLLRFFPHLIIFMVLFLAGGYLILFFIRKNKVTASFLTIVLIMVVGFLGAIEVVLPGVNPLKSAKPMCQSIIRHLPKDKEIVAYGLKLAPFNFYTGLNKIEELKTNEELMLAFNSPSVGLILLGENSFIRLKEKTLIPANIQMVEKNKIGHRSFILLEKKVEKELRQ
ncbi:MAG: glycosyltransferase family 39 protein [Thermodesulfobacteriota bacterium]|jgi:4-amino-4-deoxy-L-arabinose transferase-like glycosyltransferase|nr:MAG: glycosyltransferase family 39 protein [Thermodesulfobacteriota bacterium]